MQISSLVDIVEGDLQNTPSISFITQIHTKVSKISDGDAFIVLQKRDIPRAVEQGAFAILYENSLDIIDNEIAWVKVPSIQKAITNILRYKFSKIESIQFFYVDKVLYHFIEIFKTKELKDIVMLKDNIKQDFELLYSTDIKDNSRCFSTDLTFVQSVSPSFSSLSIPKHAVYNITLYSLFDISFSYKGNFFNKIRLPKLYINYFIATYNFFDQNIDIKRLSKFSLFRPVFINKTLEIVPFGSTNRLILANSDEDIAKQEIRYINKEYKYGSIKIIDKKDLDEKKILSYIKKYDINILYFKYIDISKIETILDDNMKVATLF